MPTARESPAFPPWKRGEGAVAAPSSRGARWIISPGRDLAFLVGGALAGYFLLFLYAGVHVDVVRMWFVWFIVLDSPHFFATYVRTVLDKDERARRGPLLRASLLCFVVGPLVLVGCLALYSLHVPHHAAPFLVLVAFVNLWAYWHVVRQHYGILMLYKRKNDDMGDVDRRVDSSLLYVGLLAPVVGFVLRNEEARRTLGLATETPFEAALIVAALVLVVLVACAFVLRQIVLWRRGRAIDLPKALFFAAVVPLHVVACYLPAVRAAPLLGFAAFVTIHHDIQYLALVWFHQRNRSAEASDPRVLGLAATVTKSWPIYVGCAVLQGAALGTLSCKLDVLPGCLPLFASTQTPLFGSITLRDLLFTVFLGALMQHYVVDQFIWRVSKDAKLVRELRLA